MSALPQRSIPPLKYDYRLWVGIKEKIYEHRQKKASHRSKKRICRGKKEGSLEELFAQYAMDERSGVKAVLNSYRKKQEKLAKERVRLEEMRSYEHQYERYGYVCGIDEAGRGPLAGPVVAGAVILPEDCEILWLNDSKQLSEKKREALYDEIMEKALAVSVGMASPARIDEINILQATYEAMREAIAGLKIRPQVLLNDAVKIPQVEISQVPIIKGDAKACRSQRRV